MKSCLGGTFDHFHKGHKALLDTAFSQSHFVLIGLSSNKFADETHKYKATLQSFLERKEALTSFLYANNYLEKSKIEEINDPIGTSTKYQDLEAIFCTEETRANAELINKRRMMCALPALKIINVPLVLAEDGLPISAERIRRGIVTIDGKVLKWTPSRVKISLE